MSPPSNSLVDLAGWLPALIFPAATLIQLVKIVREKTTAGVSIVTWFLFGIANIGLYIYVEKYASLQSILGFLGTASLNFSIAVLTIRMNAKENQLLK